MPQVLTFKGRAARRDFEIARGEDWSLKFTISQSSGLAVDLTGSAFACQVRISNYEGDVAATPTISVDVASAEVTLSLASSVTAALDIKKYVYDIFWTDSLGKQRRIFCGEITVVPAVTRPS